MARLEDLTKGTLVRGFLGDRSCKVVDVAWHGSNALTLRGQDDMAGLYCKELMIRGDVERCLVIAPGSLVEQWQDELWQKFPVDDGRVQARSDRVASERQKPDRGGNASSR